MFCLSPTKTKKKGEQCLKKQIRVTSSTCTDYFNQWQHPPPPKLHKCGRCMFFYIYKKGSCLTLECIKGCSCTWSLLFPLVLESSCMSCGGTLVFILSFSTFSTHMNRRRTAPPPPPNTPSLSPGGQQRLSATVRLDGEHHPMEEAVIYWKVSPSPPHCSRLAEKSCKDSSLARGLF